MDLNLTKRKALTNMRAFGKDDAVKCKPCINFTIEDAITYINDDELLEVTPNYLRLRKRWLDPNERKKNSKLSSKL